jgi:hypothetical protein
VHNFGALDHELRIRAKQLSADLIGAEEAQRVRSVQTLRSLRAVVADDQQPATGSDRRGSCGVDRPALGGWKM